MAVLDVPRVRGAILARLPRRPWIGLGLECDPAAVRAVVVRHHRTRTLLAAAVEPNPDPADPAKIADAIPKVLDAIQYAALPTPTITTGVGGSGVVVRFAAFPAMKRADLKRAVQFEADKYLPYQVSEVFLDSQPLGSPREGRQEVVLAAAKRELIDERLRMLQQASVTPHIIDVEAFALANAWEVTRPPAAAEVVALLGVKSRGATLDIVQGSTLRLTREFPLEAAPDAPGGGAAPVVDRLVEQLRLSCDYFENQCGHGVEQVVVTGSVIRQPAWLAQLREAVGLPVEPWDPVGAMARDPAVDGAMLEAIAPDLTIALGLGLRGPA